MNISKMIYDMSLEKTVIDNIKRIRKEKGMTQEQLAEACDTATSYIGLMEIYKNVPKLSTIERIAKAPTPPLFVRVLFSLCFVCPWSKNF